MNVEGYQFLLVLSVMLNVLLLGLVIVIGHGLDFWREQARTFERRWFKAIGRNVLDGGVVEEEKKE